MRKKTAHDQAIADALALARTGRYRNVREVEAVLKVRTSDSTLSERVTRCLIDATCYRARKARGWDTEPNPSS